MRKNISGDLRIQMNFEMANCIVFVENVPESVVGFTGAALAKPEQDLPDHQITIIYALKYSHT
jgi:hypothetical protein